jgi:hypothetical protein
VPPPIPGTAMPDQAGTWQVISQDAAWYDWYDTLGTSTPVNLTWTSGANGSIYNRNVWQQWYTTGTTTTYASNVWQQWQVAAGSMGQAIRPMTQAMQRVGEAMRAPLPRSARTQARVEDEEQRYQQQARVRVQEEEFQRYRQEASRRRLAEAERIKGAQQRALALLDSLLSPAQREHNAQHAQIPVTGSAGGLYLIETGTFVHGNVVETDAHGCRLRRLCAAPAMYQGNKALPDADGWVGQLLALQADEPGYLAVANPSHLQQCTRLPPERQPQWHTTRQYAA